LTDSLAKADLAKINFRQRGKKITMKIPNGEIFVTYGENEKLGKAHLAKYKFRIYSCQTL